MIEVGVNGDMLTIYDGDRHIPVTWTHLIPATLEGRAKFNVDNALAAAAVSFSMGMSLEQIRQGLRTFTTSFFQAPGRCNVFDEHPFRVIMDYCHNPAAMERMTELVRSLRKRRAIGVLQAAGDRRDVDIHEIGRIAASAFDIVITKEDDSRRGRPEGEVARILASGARDGGIRAENVFEVPNEPDAVQRALAMAEREDLLVIFADDIPRTWKQVIYFGKDRSHAEAQDGSATYD